MYSLDDWQLPPCCDVQPFVCSHSQVSEVQDSGVAHQGRNSKTGQHMSGPNMADKSEDDLAAVFDLLKISLSKTDPVLDVSNALKGLVVAAVWRAKAAGELRKRRAHSDCKRSRCVHYSALASFDFEVPSMYLYKALPQLFLWCYIVAL